MQLKQLAATTKAGLKMNVFFQNKVSKVNKRGTKSKSKARGVAKSKTGTHLFLLCRDRTVRSRCCIRKLFLKTLQYPHKTPVLESNF